MSIPLFRHDKYTHSFQLIGRRSSSFNTPSLTFAPLPRFPARTGTLDAGQLLSTSRAVLFVRLELPSSTTMISAWMLLEFK